MAAYTAPPRCGGQVLQGLSALHKSGIVRREVKPEYVMLNGLAVGKLPGEELCRRGLGIFIRKFYWRTFI